jgi:iron-sulfur cluster assembly protein
METDITAIPSPPVPAGSVVPASTGAPSGVGAMPSDADARTDARVDDVKTDPRVDVAVGAPGKGSEATGIVLTPKAIEMAKKALAKRGTPEAALRLGVRGGGCSGASYVIEFADTIRPRDIVTDHDGLKVVVDPKSLVYLRGAVLDYEVKLMQHGFKFRNPNERSSCGCGESFGI